jgi:serine/threonine-protein kinase
MTARLPASAPAVLAPGVTVGGKYRLLRRLGAGGMGEVWVAENRDTGAELAVKMVRGPANGDDSAARFRREARLGAKLAHRGVVRVFDLVEETRGTLVLVMELLRGETLESAMRRRGPLPTREAIAITDAVLAALAHAHDAGVIHRDVTPANVFLAIDPDGHVTPKLLDFGLAKVPAAGDGSALHTLDGRALGTPRYMAPERIRERDAIDGRSDLFSVGVILYELLTGTCPFAASSPAASLAAVLEAVVDPDPRIEPRVWLEVRRALSKRPYERQASALAMASGLLAACGETEVSLGEVLRNLPVCRDLPDSEASPGQVTRALGGHSIGASASPGPPRRRAVFALLGVLAVLAGVATIGASLRGRAAVTAPVAHSAGDLAARPPEPASEELPSGAPLPSRLAAPGLSPAASTSASAPAPSPAARTPARPARPVRPKPVAITPGF